MQCLLLQTLAFMEEEVLLPIMEKVWGSESVTNQNETAESLASEEGLENKNVSSDRYSLTDSTNCVQSETAAESSGAFEDDSASVDKNYNDNLVALADSLSGEDTDYSHFITPVEEEVTTDAKKIDSSVVAKPVAEDTPEVEDRNDAVDKAYAYDIQVRQEVVTVDLVNADDSVDAFSCSETVATIESNSGGCDGGGWNWGTKNCWVVV